MRLTMPQRAFALLLLGAGLFLTSWPALARPSLHAGLRGGYRAHIDSDADKYDGLDVGIQFTAHPKKNVGVGVLLDRHQREKNNVEFITTRLAGHLMYFQATPNRPHFFAGTGPALVFAELDYDDSFRIGSNSRNVQDDDEVTLGWDALAGYFIPLEEWAAITVDLRLSLLFLDFSGRGTENFSSLSAGLGLLLALDR